MERVNHRLADHADYSVSHFQDACQDDEEQEQRTWHYESLGDGYDAGDYVEAEEEVEHRTDDPGDDTGQSDFHAQFGWRSKMRRRHGRGRGRGRFVPPDTRGLAEPVFVRLANLRSKASPGSEEEREPAP